ncbi:MAG TPA: CoA transferase [Acidimicrobiales bacterium]|nr:CoA transferase [Acidimicrobiales bacterium]
MTDPDAAAELRVAATSGLMALTGRPDGPPLAPPSGLVRGLDRLAGAVAHWSAEVGDTVVVDWAELLTVRAKLLGLRRQGRRSANGSCRLLRGPDRWVAVNLARPEDREAVNALARGECGPDTWDALTRLVEQIPVAELVHRARLLGVPAAPLGTGDVAPGRPWSARRLWESSGRRDLGDLSIVDLSSMWAGPLTAMLLGRSGGKVVKVESASRPDGARAVPAFYRSLHAQDQPVVTLDFASAEGRRRLRVLLDEADVVIESSRPRALGQLEAAPEQVARRPGRVWVSITGYGRAEPGRHWVALGDDAAVAGGLVAWEDDTHPVFCGDALADPVTGLSAAAGLFEALAGGGGVLLDVSMQASAASLTAGRATRPSTPARRCGGAWQVVVNGEAVPLREFNDTAQPVPWTTDPATTVATTVSG